MKRFQVEISPQVQRDVSKLNDLLAKIPRVAAVL